MVFRKGCNIKYLLDETKSNIQFTVPRQSNIGQSEANIGAINWMLDLVKYNQCSIKPKKGSE